LLADVDAAARGSGIAYFVGGALARDLLLYHVHGQPIGRATRDVDVMLCLDTWAAYGLFREQLLARGAYRPDPSLQHRLWHGGEKPEGVPLDTLPFGDLEDPEGTIAWPPNGAVLMTVTGFAEAAATAVRVEVAEGVRVAVASLPALAVTKVAAWLDRHAETDKDAVDLRVLLASYHAAGNEDRLYGPESELLSEEEFDPERAGARLLARDAVRVCPTSVRQLLSRFQHEEREALRRQVVASVLRMDDDPGTERFERLLSAFWRELERSSLPPALR
jgi:predicted nucleotidyltransferase